jgi:hypothetical protein
VRGYFSWGHTRSWWWRPWCIVLGLGFVSLWCGVTFPGDILVLGGGVLGV